LKFFSGAFQADFIYTNKLEFYYKQQKKTAGTSKDKNIFGLEVKKNQPKSK
jgi:hypothetical protein